MLIQYLLRESEGQHFRVKNQDARIKTEKELRTKMEKSRQKDC
jgi:hypothetical protein